MCLPIEKANDGSVDCLGARDVSRRHGDATCFQPPPSLPYKYKYSIFFNILNAQDQFPGLFSKKSETISAAGREKKIEIFQPPPSIASNLFLQPPPPASRKASAYTTLVESR
jgi:hypothetical protein